MDFDFWEDSPYNLLNQTQISFDGGGRLLMHLSFSPLKCINKDNLYLIWVENS